MNDQADEQRWLHHFHTEVKSLLRTALIHLDADVHRQGTFFTSIVDERSSSREIAFRVGPIDAQHEIKFVYSGQGQAKVHFGQQTAEYTIDALDQTKVDQIARAWLVAIGIL